MKKKESCDSIGESKNGINPVLCENSVRIGKMNFKNFKELDAILPPLAPDDYERLKTSIKEKGIQNPIFILEDKTILDGTHRIKIAKELGIKEEDIPVKEKKINKEEALLLGLSLNLARRHLTAEQKREIIKGLRKEGYSQEEVGKIVGLTHQAVSKTEKISIAKSCNTYIPDLRYSLSKEQKEEIVGRVKKESQIQIASAYGISQARVSQIVKKAEELERQKKEISKLTLPKDKFQVIVVDPPWPYGTEYDSETRRVASPYPEMSIEEIKKIKLPVDDNCILWLWTTNAFMHEAFHVLETWEFEPKTILTWVKNRMGMGVWLRGKTEHCIMAIKGKPKINLTNQTTVIFGDLREHSRKPDEFYQLVNKLCTGNKLDYFGRKKKPGWVIYGAEAES